MKATFMSVRARKAAYCFLATLAFVFATQCMAMAAGGATARPEMATKAMPPDEAHLDDLYRSGDLASLTDRLVSEISPAGVLLDLNWEQNRMLKLGGLFLTSAYAVDLWRLSASAPGLKDTAAGTFLGALSLVLVDGFTCADQSAPQHHLDQLLAWADMLKYLRTSSAAMKTSFVTFATQLEFVLSRPQDEMLCSGGLDEVQASLKAQGSKSLVEVPNPPGTVGKTVLLPPAPDYHPKFAASDIAAPKVAAARKTLTSRLAALIHAK